jgi:hypothetical protein
MRDLFDIFPDLPKPGRRPMVARVEEVRDKPTAVRRRIVAAVEARRVQTSRVRKGARGGR